MVKNTTRARSEAPAEQSIENRLATVEQTLGTLLQLPILREHLHKHELWLQKDAADRRSEENAREAYRLEAPKRQAAFEQFAKAHLAIHTSLASAPVPLFTFYIEWSRENQQPRMDQGEFQRAMMGLVGVEWSERAVINAVGRMIPGYTGCALSNDPAADVAKLDLDQQRADRDRLQREASSSYEIASADESLRRKIARDKALRVL